MLTLYYALVVSLCWRERYGCSL